MRNTKTTIIAALLAVCALTAQAEQMRSAWYFYDLVDICNGNFRLRGTEVTATADELNVLDGITATTAQLNAAGSGSTALAAAKMWVGSAAGVQTAKTLGGDATINTNGELAIADNAVLASEVGPGTLASDVIVPATGITNALFTNVTVQIAGAASPSTVGIGTGGAGMNLTLGNSSHVNTLFIKATPVYDRQTGAVTNGGTLYNFWASYYISTSDIGCTVTVQNVSAANVGQIMLIANSSPNEITLASTNLATSTNILGQYDAIQLYAASVTNWIRIGGSDNP